MSYTRLAIYYLPPEGPLAEFGAAWFGWDAARGAETGRFEVPRLHDITKSPRKYGFHGTLKPPFRLAEGRDPGAVAATLARLAASCAPARCDGLALAPLQHFLALTPLGETSGIGRVAAACVRGLDAFRAPPTVADLARRRAAGLSGRQDALLTRWGYPYVMEEFRFHMTLTGPLPPDVIGRWREVLAHRLPVLPASFVLDEVALMGERPDGYFELIQRYALTG